MDLKPWQRSCFVKQKRFAVVKMTAGPLFHRAAGIKNSGSLRGGQARKFSFLKGSRGYGGNLWPMPDTISNNSPPVANLPIGRIVLELEGEELKRELLELSVCFRWTRTFRGWPAMRMALDELTQKFGVLGK